MTTAIEETGDAINHTNVSKTPIYQLHGQSR